MAGVDVDVVLAGEYSGDGRPKPVAFPDPEEVAVRGERVSILPLAKLIELKLASGISAPHRLRDLADVLELIRILALPRETAESLDPSVRAKLKVFHHPEERSREIVGAVLQRDERLRPHAGADLHGDGRPIATRRYPSSR